MEDFAMQDVQALTGFDLHAEEVLRHLKESRRPVELTVDGKVEVIVVDAQEYRRLQNIAASFVEFDDEGLDEALAGAEEDIRMGRVYSVREAFDEARRISGLPR